MQLTFEPLAANFTPAGRENWCPARSATRPFAAGATGFTEATEKEAEIAAILDV